MKRHLYPLILAVWIGFLLAWGAGCGGGGGGGVSSGDGDSGGNGGGDSTTIPSAPTDVAVSVGNQQLSVSWPAVTGASTYNIYWSAETGVTKASGAKIGEATSPYTHSDLTNDITYYYIVTAENSIGESDASAEVSGMPQSIESTGEIDTSFGINGIFTTSDPDGKGAQGNEVVVDSSGRILVAGFTWNGNDRDMAIWRLTSNGSLDASFGDGGLVLFANGSDSEEANDIVLDSEGRILAVGSINSGGINNMAIWRYDEDGSLDTSFSDDGYLTYASGQHNEGYGIALDSNGRILITGYFADEYNGNDMWVWCYSSGGVLDTSFGTSNAGYYESNGIAGGSGFADVGYDIVVDANDNIYATGYSKNENGVSDMVVWKLSSSGIPDSSFSGDGAAVFDSAPGYGGYEYGADIGYALTLDTSGRIVVVGLIVDSVDGSDFTVWRYTTGGELDTSLGNGLFPDGYMQAHGTAGGDGDDTGYAVGKDSSGRILAAGSSRNASGDADAILWRFNLDGSPDGTFNEVGYVIFSDTVGSGYNDVGYGVTMDLIGRIIVTGYNWIMTEQVNYMVIWCNI